jgi:hypothetical protein
MIRPGAPADTRHFVRARPERAAAPVAPARINRYYNLTLPEQVK